VIGLKENSNHTTGIVYVRTRGVKQDGTAVLEYVRWVMVRKRDESAPAPADHVPRLPTVVEPKLLGGACPPIDGKAYDLALAGSPHRFGDYAVGEKIDHVDGHHRRRGRAPDRDAALSEHRAHSLRSILGGAGPLRTPADLRRPCHSLARAISFNGLANAFHIAAINGGRHVAPLFAGGTVFAWTEVLAASELPGRSDVGALRLRTVANERSSVRGFSIQERRGLRPRRSARSRLLGVDPALIISSAPVRHQPYSPRWAE